MLEKDLVLRNVSKRYGDKLVVDGVDLTINKGDFLTILGPSGGGKTTVLKMISGFESISSGDIFLDGKTIGSIPAHKRNFGMLFQNYALFPHMTVAENVAYPLKIRHTPKDRQKEMVHDILKTVGLEEYEKRYPRQLSGGQQQRVALARSIVFSPDVLMLDEPLAALDKQLRKQMQLEIKAIHNKFGLTTISVTHDQEEALTMSDKIVVMSEGRIQQIGTPEDIYNEPKNAFVADFIGESNIFNGIMTGKLKVRFCGVEFECLDDVEHGTQVDVVVRPEDILIVSPEQGAVKGTVISVVFKGVHYEITVQSGKNEIVIQSTKSAKVGDMVGLNVEPDGIHVMPAEKALNRIETGVDKYYKLEFLDGELECDLSKIVPSSHYEDGVLMDASGDVIDHERLKVILTIKPDDITMSDDQEEGIISGHIINLIYKGDHYSYVVRTENEEDFIVHDEYLWNMDDFVSLVIPKDKIHFELKK